MRRSSWQLEAVAHFVSHGPAAVQAAHSNFQFQISNALSQAARGNCSPPVRRALKATLNKSPRERKVLIGDGMQGENWSHSPAMARIFNAADRPKRGLAIREGLVQRCLKAAQLMAPGSWLAANTRA